uniref:Uncharacterized protein n=1 Tax=Sphaerodactylus townsendi TaxID=933632 RepID=A0ACB8FRM7_9SAUR
MPLTLQAQTAIEQPRQKMQTQIHCSSLQGIGIKPAAGNNSNPHLRSAMEHFNSKTQLLMAVSSLQAVELVSVFPVERGYVLQQ